MIHEWSVHEHMPKAATARSKATIGNKGLLGKKKIYFLKKMGRLGDWKQ